MRLIKTLLLVIITCNSIAQKNLLTKLNPSIEGGVIFTNLQNRIAGAGTIDFKTKAGFAISANSEIELRKHLYLKTSAGLHLKGVSISHPVTGGAYFPGNLPPKNFKATVNTIYLDVPLIALFKKPFLTGKYFIGTGPYISYLISSKSNPDDSTRTYLSTSNQIGGFKLFNSSDDLLKKIDAGVSFLGGYEFKNGISIYLTGQTGILNIWEKSPDDPEFPDNNNKKSSLKTNSFGLSFGYKF